MPLTDTAIQDAKPSAKTVKVFDERRLYLEISPAGGKWRRLKYRFDGKEKRPSLGAYPAVRLKARRVAGRQTAEALAEQPLQGGPIPLGQPSAAEKVYDLVNSSVRTLSKSVVADQSPAHRLAPSPAVH